MVWEEPPLDVAVFEPAPLWLEAQSDDAAPVSPGTWQQVLLVDFDNRPRSRQIVVQLQGAFA